MSMSELCASIVSWTRIGRAYVLISWSLPLPLGYCTTDTFVIVSPSRVSSTWTGPHRVCATSPVTVLVDDPLSDDPASDDPVSDDPVPDDPVPPLMTELCEVVAIG